jgi:hypothetical protein
MVKKVQKPAPKGVSGGKGGIKGAGGKSGGGGKC